MKTKLSPPILIRFFHSYNVLAQSDTISPDGKVIRKEASDDKVFTLVEEMPVFKRIRVVSEMANWLPGCQNGKPVNVEMIAPIKI